MIEIRTKPLHDLNDRDLDLNEICISNIPRRNHHIGSFCYIASIITAIGRT